MVLKRRKKIHVYVYTEPHISEAQKKYMNKQFSDPVTSMHRGRLNSLKLSAAWDLQQGRQQRWNACWYNINQFLFWILMCTALLFGVQTCQYTFHEVWMQRCQALHWQKQNQQIYTIHQNLSTPSWPNIFFYIKLKIHLAR